jgi:hypothetical protein
VTTVLALGDAVPQVKAVIAALFGATVDVRDELDAGWNVLAPGSKPTIVVDDDGGPVTWPIYAHTTLRITSFANGKQTARHLRRCAMGALLAARLPGVYLPKESPAAAGIGYTEARDPLTGADVASFTVAATVQTQTVTV